MAFSRLFPDATNSVVAVNGAGFRSSNTNVDTMFSLLSGATDFDTDKITNVVGSAAMDLVSQDWLILQQPVGKQEIYTESANLDTAFGHGKSQMTDSLAIYNLFASVDPSLDVDTITGILNAYNVDNTNVLETALAAVGGIYGESFQAFETDRNTFYTNLYDLGKVVSQGTVQSLAEASASEIEFAAREETAALYALVKMNPFAITGVDYSSRNQDGLLDLANYSDNYLEDRALFLYHTTHPDAPSPTAYDIKFQDTALGREASASNGTVDLTDDQHYIFGNLEGELIEGEGEEDHLYGMAGDDQIFGNGGNDYIEGGKGQDVLNGGAGDDTIRVHSLTTANSIEEIDGGAGTNYIEGTDLNDVIDLSGMVVSNIDAIDGGAGMDTLIGTAVNDTLIGGNDTLDGHADNEVWRMAA